MGKVRFGLSNAHYSVLDETAGTYGTPVAIEGAVKMAIKRVGSSSTFYADNVAYESFDTNGGYTGTLEIATVNDTMLKDLLGMIVDANGMLLEDSAAKQVPFALMYEVESNDEDCRFVFYSCKLSRPEMDANTTTDKTDPDTQSLDITMIGRDFEWDTGATKNIVKGHMENTTTNAAKYADFMKAVLIPTKASA